MRRLVFAGACVAGIILASASCSAILGDFDVSSSTPPDATPGDTGGNPQNDAEQPLPEAGPDGALICPANTADCDMDPTNGCETSLLAPESCGACGRACGGTAACTAGHCGSEVLSSTLDHPFGFAVAGGRALWMSPTAVFGCSMATCSTTTAIMADIETTTNNPAPGTQFSPRQIVVDGATFYYERCASANSDCSPAACAVTGCKLTESTYLVPSSGNRRTGQLVGGPGALYTWQGIDGLMRYTIPAPTNVSSPGYGIGDYNGAMHVDPDHFVYIDDNASVANPTGGLYVCPIAGCSPRPPTLLAPPVRLLAFGKGIAITSTGGAGQSSASVIACGLGGCGGAGMALATAQPYISDIVADDKDVYWSTVGAPNATTNTAPVGALMRCPLPSCAGGPVKVADQLVNPVGIALDADYVYWVTYGTGASLNGTLVRQHR